MEKFKIRCSQIGKIMGASKKPGQLSETCTTYLKKWYAEQMFGYKEEIFSKYLDKGNACENEAIDMIAERLGLGVLIKNEQFFENEFMTGTPDVVCEIIADSKCSWDAETFLKSVFDEIDSGYEWQLIGYMELTGKEKAKICYCLLDTPEECNYGNEVIFSHIPVEKRFYSVEVLADKEKIKLIEKRVEECRNWLSTYDLLIKAKLNL